MQVAITNAFVAVVAVVVVVALVAVVIESRYKYYRDVRWMMDV